MPVYEIHVGREAGKTPELLCLVYSVWRTSVKWALNWNAAGPNWLADLASEVEMFRIHLKWLTQNEFFHTQVSILEC